MHILSLISENGNTARLTHDLVKAKEMVGNSWTVLSYFGSQILSQSLNEAQIYRLQPKSAVKGEFFHMFLSLIVSSSWCMLPFDV